MRALVELLGDASSLSRTFRSSAAEADRFGGQLQRLNVDVRKQAQAQVQASLRKDARLRTELTEYKRVAAAAVKGSREQVAAANLATRAQRRLAGSIGVSARESKKLAHAERDVERGARGFLAGAGGLREFGRSAVFASGAFIGAASITEGLKSSLNAARDSRATMGQLANAVKDAGLSYRGLREALGGVIDRAERLGFTEEQSVRTLGFLVRASQNAGKASRELSLSEDIARGRHIALATASNAVARAEAGQTGALRRLLPFIGKHATAVEAVRQAQAKYAGAAGQYANSEAGAQDRLNVALERTRITIGEQLAPTVARLETRLATWLDKSKNQARVQRDLHQALVLVKDIVQGLTPVVRAAAAAARKFADAVGGGKNAVELLAGAFVATKIVKLIGAIGGASSRAAEAAGALASNLAKLSKIGPIKIPIAIPGAVGAAAVIAEIAGIVTQLAGDSAQGSTPGGTANFPLAAKLGGYGKTYDGSDLEGLPKNWLSQHLYPEVRAYRQHKITPGQLEKWLQAHFKQLRAAGLVNPDDLELSKDLALIAAAQGGTQGASQDVPVPPGFHSPTHAAGRTSPAPLTDAQKLKVALAAHPNSLKLLGQQATNDRAAIAFLQQRLAAGKITGKAYVAAVTAYYDDLNSTLDQIASIENTAAAKAKAKAEKARLAAQKAETAYTASVAATIRALKARAGTGGISAIEALIAQARKDAKDGRLTVATRRGYQQLVAAEQGKLTQARQYAALGLGPSGHGQSPLKETLAHELARVKSQLRGTLLDTDKNTHLLNQIGRVLDGQFGKLTDKTRAAVRKLLDTLSGELKKGTSRFGPGGRVISAEQWAAGLGLHGAALKAAEARFAQASAHQGRKPAGVGVNGQTVVINVNGVGDPDHVARKVVKHIQAANRRVNTPTRGMHGGVLPTS